MDKNSRIPADQGDQFTTWAMPTVEHGNMLGVASLERRARDETVAKDRLLYANITAGQLEKITNDAWNEGKNQGYQEGLAQGKKDGHQAGLQQGLNSARQQVQQHIANLQTLMQQLIDPLQGQQEAVESALVGMAAEMAKALLRRELAGDTRLLEGIVRDAVAALPIGSGHITVYLNAQDQALLREQGQLPPQWQLLVEPALLPGGCQVVADQSLVEFSLESRLRNLVAELLNRDAAPTAVPKPATAPTSAAPSTGPEHG